MFKSPIDFAEDIRIGKHIVLFYENAEYCRSISFAFLKSGMENKEHCYYFTSEKDTELYKNEFIETMFGPNFTYEYNKNPNVKFDESLLYVGNIEFIFNETSTHRLTDDIINIVNRRRQVKEKNEVINNEVSRHSRVLLKFNDKIKNKSHIENNIRWENDFRNTQLRKDLSGVSLICAYPLDNIIETINGESAHFSYWMSELLEIYDGVIYAKANWKGVGLDLGK